MPHRIKPLRGYYAILDVPVGEPPEASLLRARALLAAGPCMLQLRAKGPGAGAMAALARGLAPLCRAAAVPLCVNDRLDVALAVGADACHLGQDDLPLSEARAVAAGRLALGISTHDLGQARAAAAGGADYLGFGPIFPTASKARPDPVVGVEELRVAAAAVAIPVVAIGGITLDTVAAVAATGCAAAAVIAAVNRAPDPAAAGLAVGRAFSR